MNDIELLKDIAARLYDDAEGILENIEDLERVKKTVDKLIAVEHLRAERIADIRHRMFVYAQTKLQETGKERDEK